MADGSMARVTLGADIEISANGQRGQVVGKYEQLAGAVSFRVRYADQDGVLHETWMAAREFELSPTTDT